MREPLGDFVDKPPLEESLRALAARRRSGENHPAPEELVAYRAGDLTAEEDDLIQEHLTQCHDCARLLLDLAEFEQLPPPPEELGPVDARAEASWQRLRSRLREDEEPEVEQPPVLQHRPRPRVPLWRRPALPWALAAGLALCVVGLGWRTGSLERQIEELSRPQAVQVVTLVSEEERARGAGDEAPVRAGDGVAYNLLLPSDPEVPTYPLYEVKIVSATGEAKPIPVGRQPADEDVLKVSLRAAPDPGDYVFEISGIAGDQEAPVGRYPFTVLPAR
jgi:hypothetical protein